MFSSFKRGLHLADSKLSAEAKIVVAPVPKRVVIPLQQHIGQICEPLVRIGDKVKLYQKIADSNALVSAPVHSSVSGVVLDIREHPSPNGLSVMSIIIEKSDEKEMNLDYDAGAESYDAKRILGLIREAGIVGLGGAAFPTHVKLQPKKHVDTLIVNGCECEPYLTADYRLMLEKTEEIVKGIRLELKVLDIESAIVAIEDNKPMAVQAMKNALAGDKDISVVTLKTKYPEGAEKLLIKVLLGRKCKHSSLPSDVGVLVSNVATCRAVHDAVYCKKPLVERVVTVTGDVRNPKNLLVRIGTQFSDVIKFCGGHTGVASKLISGGPMMGTANFTDEVPVTKATTGIIVMDKIDRHKEMHCIGCGRCVDACPYDLMPTIIAKASAKSNWQLAELYYAMECMECGCCAYVCPSRIPLVQHIRLAKQEISKLKK